jgi:hypothetical protein
LSLIPPHFDTDKVPAAANPTIPYPAVLVHDDDVENHLIPGGGSEDRPLEEMATLTDQDAVAMTTCPLFQERQRPAIGPGRHENRENYQEYHDEQDERVLPDWNSRFISPNVHLVRESFKFFTDDHDGPALRTTKSPWFGISQNHGGIDVGIVRNEPTLRIDLNGHRPVPVEPPILSPTSLHGIITALRAFHGFSRIYPNRPGMPRSGFQQVIARLGDNTHTLCSRAMSLRSSTPSGSSLAPAQTS